MDMALNLISDLMVVTDESDVEKSVTVHEVTLVLSVWIEKISPTALIKGLVTKSPSRTPVRFITISRIRQECTRRATDSLEIRHRQHVRILAMYRLIGRVSDWMYTPIMA